MRNRIIFPILLFLSLQGCQKDNLIIPDALSNQIMPRSGGGKTILGNRLTNPFTVANVQAAYSELYNDHAILTQSHTYIRFLPKNEVEVKTLVENFPVLEDTPMDYEISYLGDYYHDEGLSESDFTWLYTVIPVNTLLPTGIEYEVIDDLILIKSTTVLYYRMYDRTGNGNLLEKGPGNCTPECSNFPCCYNVNTPCSIGSCTNVDPDPECYEGGPNWPACLLDNGDGASGSGGTSPPNSCGCNINVNPLRPSGKISVDDTQFGLQGVKNITLRAQNDIFGFSWSHTQTDVNGCFKFSRSFTVKNITVRLLYNNERIWMRSYRGARIWNMILPMTSRLRTINRPFNDECIVFEDDNLNGESSVSKEEWAGCTVFNAIEEYHTFMPGFGLTLPSGRLEVTITHHGKTAGAPMLSEHFEENILDDFVIIWLGIIDPIAGLVIAAVREALPDIWYAYDLNEFSDEMKQVVYHEFGHASHYTHVNTTDFWGVYRSHIIFHGGYGDGNDNNSELVAVSEPFAEVVGVTMADISYGTNHSNGNPVNDRWIFELEEENLNSTSSNWIPWGIYYDLIDNNTTNPSAVFDSVIDDITGYQITSMFNVLDGNVRTMSNLEQRMLNILPGSATSTQVNSLFNEYGF